MDFYVYISVFQTSVVVLSVVGVSLLSVVVSFFRGGLDVLLPEGNELINGTNVTAPFTGFSSETFNDNMNSHYGPDYTSNGDVVNFAIVFGVLFSGEMLY
jgi:potassium/chloride transporter 9